MANIRRTSLKRVGTKFVEPKHQPSRATLVEALVAYGENQKLVSRNPALARRLLALSTVGQFNTKKALAQIRLAQRTLRPLTPEAERKVAALEHKKLSEDVARQWATWSAKQSKR